MTRVVIHAGFHKTATSSVQAMLRANAQTLAAEIRVVLREDIDSLASITGAYPLLDGADRLKKISRRAFRFFKTCDTADPRPILVSCEDLAGTIPGRLTVTGYAGTTEILSRISRAAKSSFGSELDLVYFFSTRSPADWLRSTWWQNLRSSRLTEDLSTYSARLCTASDHETALRDIAQALYPVRVTSLSLEECQDLPHGPLMPLLELVGVSTALRAALIAQPPANVRPDLGLEEVFLALNRSRLSDKDLRSAKRSLLRMVTNNNRP
ncbi:MAG: hypothetical protein MK160_04405 [Rhodobacteraceae bacterium]|nr:hypothetical protein [Paracoccaceae bacterium]